jgi:hypothetical protein
MSHDHRPMMGAMNTRSDTNIDALRHSRSGDCNRTSRGKDGKNFLHGSFSLESEPRR